MPVNTDLISTFWLPVLFFIIGIPFILKRIPPNHILGIRTKGTLSNETYWYNLHRTFGIYLLGSGIILFVFRLMEPNFEVIQGYYKALLFILIILVIFAMSIHIKGIGNKVQ